VTLPRVLEIEAMDTLEVARAYDALDHSEVNRQYVGDLLDQLPGSGPVLDLGTGTARIPIELCREEPDIRVIAVDLAKAMLDVAADNVRQGRLEAQIKLQRADVKRLPFDDGSFPVIISNSLIHHAAVPDLLLREAWRVLADGGLIFFRDLTRPNDETALAHVLEIYASQATDSQRQMFADSLRASLTIEEIQCRVQRLGAPPESVQPSSDRHWTWCTRKICYDG
jgi:ubiquinone/menaquinone biosynthesis C-methylase UbiE